MTLRRIFGLMLLFLFFEAVIAVITAVFFEQVNILIACLSMTALAIGTWLVFFLVARYFSHRPAKGGAKTKALIAVESNGSGGADDSFVLEFTSLLNEANGRLQALTSGQSNRVAPTVNSLPLYLVMGPEGSGKTTVIVNSGLEPRLLAGDATRDGQIVPTSTANFWYAEGAIFVEISGRILMQEPTRWEKALRLLSERRSASWWKRLLERNTPRTSNLRGVLIACDTEAFLHAADPRGHGATARTFNERLQMAQTIMCADFPTYVIFTKLDSMSNFQELFSHLTDTEAKQVFGVTLTTASSAPNAEAYADRESSRITKLFDRLYQSVGDKRLAMLAREDSVERRARAYEFPRELKKIRSEVVQFLIDVSRPSNLNPACRLRGFYFMAKQLVPSVVHSVPADSVDTISFRPAMGATTILSVNLSAIRDYGTFDSISPARSRGKWIFLTELFRQVILLDRTSRNTAPPLRAGDSRHLHIALGVIGSLSLLLSVIWGASWRQNHQLLTQVQAAVLKSGKAPAQSPLESLRELELIRLQMVRLQAGDGSGVGLSYHWGLYSGAAAAADLDRLYYAQFRQAILDPALATMSGRFLQLGENASAGADVYEELKSYRTITSGSCPVDESTVAASLIGVWNDYLSQGGEEQSLAERQIRLYTAHLKSADPFGHGIPENSEAVVRAQVYLRSLTGPEKALQSIVEQIQPEATDRLSAYASNYSQVLSGPDRVEAQFTIAGCNAVLGRIHQHKLISNGDPCVIGVPGKASAADTAMEAQVQKLYTGAYIQFWNSFFEAHHVADFSGSLDAAQKLRVLADNNRSPLLALIYMTSANTNVSVPETLREKASHAVKGADNIVTKTLRSIAGGPAKAGAAQITQQQDLGLVGPIFDSLHIMVDPSARDKWLNERNQPYMKALGDMSDALMALPPEVHNEVPLEMQQLQQARTAIAGAEAALHTLAGNFPNGPRGIDVDLQNLLREPIEHARRVVYAVRVAEPARPVVAAAVPPAPPVNPIPVIDPTLKPAIEHLNAAAVRLCSVVAPMVHKFPFDASSTSDVSVDELNQLLQPGTGAYPMFSNLPEASRAYNHSGRIWAQKPEFPAAFSQSFIHTLNGYGETQDAVYGAVGDAAHVDFTITVDGTGKIPFQLEVDGHILKHSPGHPTPPLHMVWPPITNGPTQLTIKSGWRKKGGMQTGVWTGPWALFHLLQSADDQSGNVFTFRTVEFARSLNPLTNGKGTPGTIQIRIDSPTGNIFGRGYFSKLRCSDDWAVRQQGPGN